MLQLHDILLILDDLCGKGELELAQQISAYYMLELDSGELRFRNLTLLAELGRVEQVMDWIDASLDTNQWFSSWFIKRTPALLKFSELPRFQRLMAACDEHEAQYWLSGANKPVIQTHPSTKPPYSLLIVMHGNGFHSQHSADCWSAAAEAGWLVFHPLAMRLVGYGMHWWADHDENREIVMEQAASVFAQYPIDLDRVLLGGFSKGGEVAMVLALQGQLRAKGFITVGAGGYFHLDPEHWRPLLQAPPPCLRGVALYDAYDLQRAGDVEGILETLREAGVDVRLEMYPAEGHTFPADFAGRFHRALDFLLPKI